jgi:peptidoglycan hydrolase-like protein with peptidoglycan-binding domain
MSEFVYVKDIAQGARGARAKLVQECLVHHEFRVVVDGKFGPATRTAVALFQSASSLAPTGVVNRTTFDALVAPFLRVQRPIDGTGLGLGALTFAYAKQHLAEHPIEIGGQNRGP